MLSLESPTQEFCMEPSHAFLGNHLSKQCITNFPAPYVKGLHKVEKKDNKDVVDDKYDGYQLTWTSQKTCKGEKKYKYTLNVLCDANAEPHKDPENDYKTIWSKV